ncbi:hypothetical protein SAMN05428945_5484 [Streptomyces sp. 2224.1]|uniref:hypothetical protein n=1 Tax=unclassified Streptomyces TaxID=2593676 RepID=UPI00088B1813|nr:MULTISPECIES: hypothetical protein [unclassified Streptomyces]PBC86929.1 hypothetical protein BX261_7050 [Streptomyces sp. 2321.6]SDQ67546.1 hypothetical protein SAMN05216511_0199 [Streptomyces sp. KS_16]SED36575.1 hypothetical protein SAMN05428954_0166 [Streptomyces sp. 2112.3]SED77685.1 hypothetical protein SAMN05428945_5484 [Streptomyces sp. 2224.1]SEE13903.1 hypothetical protein SAMN05428940_7074 [Streptomyces sp. 2133.1]
MKITGRCLPVAPAPLAAMFGTRGVVGAPGHGAPALRATSAQAADAIPDDFIWPRASASPSTGGGSARDV